MSDKKKPTLKNFVILVGGPGTFRLGDNQHDTSWKNYIAPVQIETRKEMQKHSPQEIVHWWVYAPAYEERWKDDVSYTSSPHPIQPQRNFFESRKKAIEQVRSKGATSYLDRIHQSAKQTGVKFRTIDTPDAFWTELGRFPDGSISRVWYVGHACKTGLILKLTHTPDGRVGGLQEDMVNNDAINRKKPLLANKMSGGADSKFYGCFTSDFAKDWNKAFSVATDGAINKIDFSVIDSSSGISDVMERLENSEKYRSSEEPGTQWTHYPAKAGR